MSSADEPANSPVEAVLDAPPLDGVVLGATPGNAPPAPGLRRIGGNFAYLLGGKTGAGLISLAYLAIAAHRLGVTGFGMLSLVHGYIALVGGVIAFSGWHPLVRYGAQAMAAGDRPRLARLARFMALTELALGGIAILVAMALAPWIGPRLGWDQATTLIAIPYALAIVAGVKTTPNGLLQIAGRFDLIAALQMVNPLVRLAGALAAWALDGGLAFFLAVWLASALAEAASMWWLGWREWRRIDPAARLTGPIAGVRADNLSLLGFMTRTNIDFTLRELAPRLAPLAVGWVLGPAAAGLFALAGRASMLFSQPALLLGQAGFSVLAALHAAGERRRLAASVWKSGLFALAASLPVLALMALYSGPVLVLFGGQAFAGGAGLLLLLAASRAIALLVPSLSNGLIVMGHPGRSIAAALVANLGLFPLMLWMMHRFGLAGAGWHAVLVALVNVVLLAGWFTAHWRRGD